MLEISLTYPTPEGTQTIKIDGERTSFGRGSETDHRFDDEGLSRLNSTIYREGDKVWVVDENSTNGTFVNGEKPPPSGRPLQNDDSIKIGHKTVLTVHIAETAPRFTASAAAASSGSTVVASSAGNTPFNWIPIAVIAGAFFVICVSMVFIGITVFGGGGVEIAKNQDNAESGNDDPIDTKPTPRSSNEVNKATNAVIDNSLPPDTPTNTNGKSQIQLPIGKKYLEMSDAEQRQYLEAKAMRVAQVIGNNNSDSIPAAAIDKIKTFVQGYASRIKSSKTDGCTTMRPWSDSLQFTYEKASKNAPFIMKAFNEKGMDPRIGLYLAMIESEHCTCLQSGTGPLGMFQFTYATAALHFSPSTGVVKGASPSHPDVRCQPEPAAHAAASYMKALAGRYGTGPSSVPLAIASYNSGEGGLSSNLEKALSSNPTLQRDFWSLIANMELLNKQFQTENFKYVPKFFAAAIIGENPQDFGLTLQPISTYSK
ncbi:MAG: FHA domain-containing protein [Acidobacteriota bacterium]